MEPALRTRAVPPRRSLAGVWFACAVLLGALLVLSAQARGPLDDPDPARQRPGLLDLGALPSPAPRVSAEVPTPGRAALVLFERPDRLARLCEAIGRHRFADSALVVVVAPGPGGACAPGVAVVEDPTGALAAQFGLDRTRDAGAPVGYAVVDGQGEIRYRTLDPSVAARLGEIDTILRATR